MRYVRQCFFPFKSSEKHCTLLLTHGQYQRNGTDAIKEKRGINAGTFIYVQEADISPVSSSLTHA
jgi:hypothetical protein